MALSMHDAFVGITTRLTEFGESKRYRHEPDVRVSYVDTNNERQIVTICPYGARILAKALKEMADLADPPPKRRKKT
jgi:hypothetical protein